MKDAAKRPASKEGSQAKRQRLQENAADDGSLHEEEDDAEEEEAGGTFWHRDRILSLLDTYRSYRKEMIKGRRKKHDIWKDVILRESWCALLLNNFY